ncbi:unnamed protein product [Brachionus calyciflorus]|uniref:Reverse transcriptase domain-containing protein n=1 Tax=Brachionus calyciflorus TaxID=104777 RepID=A0A813V9U4_9BILA|nr:unnamed protein product [Brachionus calyciflorus]
MFDKNIVIQLDEKIDTTIDLDVARNEIFKLFNESEICNKEIENKSKEKVDKLMKDNCHKIFDMKLEDDEIIEIIQKLPNNKASGYNRVSNEMIKYELSPKLLNVLKLIFETIINYDIMPKNFNIGVVKLLVKDKNKDHDDINNLRTLTISDKMAIIYEKIILKRINKKYQGFKNQFGFRTNSSCGHAVFALKESVLFNRTQNKRTIGATIDASKAFDKVNRVNLWYKLMKIIEAYLLRSFINYYLVSKIVIFINNKYTNIFIITRGVKQGGPLSPLLFAIYINQLSALLDTDPGGIIIGEIKINNILYADDILLQY